MDREVMRGPFVAAFTSYTDFSGFVPKGDLTDLQVPASIPVSEGNSVEILSNKSVHRSGDGFNFMVEGIHEQTGGYAEVHLRPAGLFRSMASRIRGRGPMVEIRGHVEQVHTYYPIDSDKT
jgi:hypothetical protein